MKLASARSRRLHHTRPAPAICRAFDCRQLFLSKTRAERTKSGVVSNEVFSAGRKRLKTLDLPR